MSGAGTTLSGLVYDTGALIAAERNDRRMWAMHARGLARGILPIVPAGCVVEAWRGDRQVSLSRLLDGCEVEPLDDDTARRAGALLASTKRAVGPVDPTVVDVVLRRGAAVVTADRDDLSALARGVRDRLSIIDI
ncbi:MAG: PIN domain-containing protein [Ilumatobacteraceae bacterium]